MQDPETQATRGTAAAEISNQAVRLLHEYTGRGPTKAKTTINPDCVLILLRDTLTKAERSLVARGEDEIVVQMRHRFQETMRNDLVATVENVVQRKVVAFMSTNHIDPDMAAEVFVLEPQPDDGEPTPRSA